MHLSRGPRQGIRPRIVRQKTVTIRCSDIGYGEDCVEPVCDVANIVELTMDTERENVPNWDSFNYVNFIVAVEREFGVRFKVGDIASFPNVGAIVKETQKMLA
jgi:acyl carrier protein